MRVRRAEALLVRLPFVFPVRHALAERGDSLNLLVRLEDEEGREGWGEGVPRGYVTGEGPEDAFGRLTGEVLPRLLGAEVAGPGALLPAIAELLPPREGAQAAGCAAELALLDLAGRAFSRSVAQWFGGARRPIVHYGGVLPLLGDAEQGRLLAAARRLGLGHLKVKVSGELGLDAVERAREALGEGATVSVDANGSWEAAAAAGHLRRLERLGVVWVEQPLPRGAEGRVPALARHTTLPLMADESLTTLGEAGRLRDGGGFRLFNLRLSKLGGLAASHAVARLAAAAGIGVQVGCQVGESSILSAAGRLLAATLPATVAVEGSFGSRLLARDVTEEPFEFGGRGEGQVQGGEGLDVAVSRALLDPLIVRAASLP